MVVLVGWWLDEEGKLHWKVPVSLIPRKLSDSDKAKVG